MQARRAMRWIGPPRASEPWLRAPVGRRRLLMPASRWRLETQRFSLCGSPKRGSNPLNQKYYLAGVVPLLKSPVAPCSAPPPGLDAPLPSAGAFLFLVRFLFFFLAAGLLPAVAESPPAMAGGVGLPPEGWGALADGSWARREGALLARAKASRLASRTGLERLFFME